MSEDGAAEGSGDGPVSARVRPAAPSDAPRLARLRYEFRSAEDPAVESREEFVARCEPWMRRRLDPAGERWRCWLAEAAGGTRGHAWLHVFPKIPNPADGLYELNLEGERAPDTGVS